MPQSKSRRAELLVASAIFAATFAVFAMTLGFDFVGVDDGTFVTENFHVQGGLTLDGIRWALTSFHASN